MNILLGECKEEMSSNVFYNSNADQKIWRPFEFFLICDAASSKLGALCTNCAVVVNRLVVVLFFILHHKSNADAAGQKLWNSSTSNGET